jgi:hypothetical protein
LTCTTSSGGKNPGAARARQFVQAGEAVFEETLPPHADDLAPGVESGGDLIVGQAFGGKQDHSGADDLEIRQRILGSTAAQFPLFGSGELDREWAGAWHREGDLVYHDGICE